VANAQEDILDHLIRAARVAGADAADALIVGSVSSTVSYRLGKLEDVERSESSDLGLRVFVGERVAFVSSTDLSLRLAPEDKYAGLAPADRLARSFPSLDIEDTIEPPPDLLIARARDVEGAAMAVPGITNSEGGGASFSRSSIALATSEGFSGSYAGTSHSLGVAVLAGDGTAMERDYDSAAARHTGDLESAEEVGRRAGQRTISRLNPRKVKTQDVPVVYDPRVSAGLLGHFAGAISGASIARGVSFLKDRMGEEIFSPGITIIDDPHRLRGLRSKPFDGEGVRNKRTVLVERGVLQGWILDCASARQLGLATTGHAARGTGGPPSPSTTNLYMEPGTIASDMIVDGIVQGFYVTELMGMGVNSVTGDYSRGASGFWIENGELAYPVSEVTIAGNLKDMFRHMTPANDLVFRYGTNAPTVLVEGMTVAGA
jgi:PmbA protein